MSIDATRWAWTVELKDDASCKKSSKRLVLLSLADRCGEDHTCWPSTKRLTIDTCMDRKTILAVLTELMKDGLVRDTGERKGATKQVRVFQLLGVNGREQTIPKTGQFKKPNDPKNGTGNDPKNGTGNDPKNGTRNLSMNLSMNLSIEHEWIPDLEQLCCVLATKGYKNKLKDIIGLPSFEFELGAFNAHNSGRVLGDGDKLYKFAAWVSDKYERYVKQNPDYSTTNPQAEASESAPLINLPAKPKGFLGGAK